ncbi:MAG TPA: peptidoglycan DD-metalloendopeptidase family protein [Burkholderiales bacterium]|nr:peptidoglycan DD-metalloendopeptidase family protein [Burkholderiales bacterium]
MLLAAVQAQAATREEDLAALRARIDALRTELEGRESERREARDALRASETAISAANRKLHAQEAAASEARADLGRLSARRDEQQRALNAQQGALGRLLAARAVARLAGSAPDFVRLALSGEDLADSARRLHYLAYVSRESAAMIEAQRAGLAELARLREASEAKTRELAAIETEGRATRDELLRERREQRRVFERVSAEVRSARRQMKVLEADEARLARVVEEIGKLLAARPGAGYARVSAVPEAGNTTGPFAEMKGRLHLPVRGELVGHFGAERTVGTTSAKGVFIRAPGGEPVRAIAPGRVVYADWMRGYGNLLIVDHGDAFLSIYGNNESLLKQPGDAVRLGEAVATVGRSGGNEETGLYFELRHLGRPFDPLSWVTLK